MPTSKIGVYTRFFEYANFRLPISTFLVNMLKYYRIHISQLSVIGAAKVCQFEILCRVHGFEPKVGLVFERLKRPFFWIDDFACTALFSWHTRKNVSRDVIPKSFEFSPKHYATPVTYPAPFHKYPEPFLFLVGMSCNYILDENTYSQFLRNDDEEMDLLSFIRTADPTKVRIGERQPSVDKLFDEEGSGEQAEQGDSASGGHGVGIDVVAETIVKDVAPVQLKRQKKRKTKVADAGEPSHPAQKLKDDYRTPGGPTVGEREDGDHTELLARANLCAIGSPQRFVISSDSSDHSSVNIAEVEVDSVVRTSMPIITSATTTPTAKLAAVAKEKLVGSSVFGADSPSAGGSHPISGGFSDCSGSDFLVGGIRTVIDPDSNLQKKFVPQWNVTNGSCLDDGSVYCEMVDEFAPLKFFASIRGMDHDQLFTEFNVGAARQISLSAEVRMRSEYHIKEKRRLKAVVE
uniref:Transposase (Putative), gypsy type n=1 Tax=Tanacetum cinerariifolium TaxID=118510 RepID=A0A699JBD6_TANCI|nr:hypothetical protein [Tanacetum cinerariifolium]